ncbi:MAG: alpha-glucuronidase, partial [Prevotella sp.]|nr:alpha-glucuronidase [Prevotellaceae bacterium]MDY5344309.1 alpha-glucuronidase [Prevotella sp.]
MLKLLLSIVMIAFVGMAKAEDGSKLWLRAEKNVKAKNVVTFKGKSDATTKIAVKELLDYWHGKRVALHLIPNCGLKTGAYRVASTASKIDVTAASSQGILYAAYHLLRCQQMGVDVTSGDNIPAFDIRILNHWDNLDGSIERGYAGKSIWIWDEITEQKTGGSRRASLGKTSYQCSESLRQHITEYARANASIGINGAVLNNVNASPQMLSPIYINKVKAIADILRPYGIKTYLSVNFASPMALGGLKTADPLNPEVAQWWKDKAKEIYEIIPDFGGFLVKANSEGQPGPGDYNRKHADGANILADAVKPYGGIIMWRCFVYGNKHKGEDRVKQAVTEFEPEDGLFRDNVILQAKNGPLDFQPREPYAPVFDQIKKTPLMAELQITQEYLGQSIHLTYLAPMWKEFFSFVSPQSL